MQFLRLRRYHLAIGIALVLLGAVPSYATDAEKRELTETSATRETTVADLQKLAASGDANATVVLGYEYFLGERVPMDREKALVYYAKAAELGSDVAMGNICNMYLYGYGVEKDPAAAFQWCQNAAKLGNPNAMVMIAEIVFDRQGLLRDKTEEFRSRLAFQFYEMAASRGHMVGQFNAGKFLEAGVGTTRNVSLAISYSEASAKQGYAPASSALRRLGFGDAAK